MGTMRGNTNWVIYDVGGARNQRHTWAPYFQDGESVPLPQSICPEPEIK